MTIITKQTLQEAIATKYQVNFEHVSLKNSDGTPVRCRQNGKLQTWKRDPAAFKLPVKYGLRECFYITNENASEWRIV